VKLRNYLAILYNAAYGYTKAYALVLEESSDHSPEFIAVDACRQ